MRPPQNAGEDSVASIRRCASSVNFNEAPAERGGRPQGSPRCLGVRLRTSMRPPQNAGEDAVGIPLRRKSPTLLQ